MRRQDNHGDYDIPRRRKTSWCGPERLCGSPCCASCFGKAAAQAYVDSDDDGDGDDGVVEEDMDEEVLGEDEA